MTSSPGCLKSAQINKMRGFFSFILKNQYLPFFQFLGMVTSLLGIPTGKWLITWLCLKWFLAFKLHSSHVTDVVTLHIVFLVKGSYSGLPPSLGICGNIFLSQWKLKFCIIFFWSVLITPGSAMFNISNSVRVAWC